MNDETGLKSFEDSVREEFVAKLPKVKHFPGNPMNDFTGGKASTISEKTLEQYVRIGSMLFNRFLKDFGLPNTVTESEVNPIDFARWFIQGNGSRGRNDGQPLSKSTYRLYRAAVWWFIGDRMQDHTNFDEACQFMKKDSENTSRNYAFERKQTTALRLKKFPEKDFIAVIEWLEQARKVAISNAMIYFLKASLLTGLRPHEWEYAALYERGSEGNRKIILAVPNSKHSNGRATGDARLIDISSFHEEDYEVIKQNIKICERWRGKWASKDKEMSRIFKKINKELWPRRKKQYMLYSCRHQAIANLKVVYDKATIAAIVGHGSTNTAGEHYGRRRSGSSSVRSLPKPVEGELNMSLVREHSRLVEKERKSMEKEQKRMQQEVPEVRRNSYSSGPSL